MPREIAEIVYSRTGKIFQVTDGNHVASSADKDWVVKIGQLMKNRAEEGARTNHAEAIFASASKSSTQAQAEVRTPVKEYATAQK